MNQTRRSLLSVGAGTVATAVAGCLSEVGFQDAEGGYAAFYTLQDWANAVGGDRISFETPVDVGDMGHGWSPSSDLITDLGTSRAFVYLDSSEFSWAQDAAEVLERDYEDVAVIDGLEGLDLLETDHEVTHDDTGEAEDHEKDDHDEDEHDEEGDDPEDDAHDHGRHDPHVWLDPIKAQTIVETIASGLAAAEPNGEETFRENAAAYADRLDELDRQFRAVVSAVDRPFGVLASHDSFRYLQERYGFVLHTPTGVSPDQSPSQSEIAETIDVVDSAGIDTILYDRFESESLARTIVENSEATATEAITPAAGTTERWRENDWGYVEQMEAINVPALEAALVTRD